MAAIGGTVAQEHCGGFSFENCKRILLLLIRIVPRFTTLLQIFIVVVLALLPIQSTSLSSSLPTSSSTAFLLDVRYSGSLPPQNQFLPAVLFVGKNCYCIAYVETMTVQIPRLHKCCSCSGWCRLEWSNFTYSVPTWVMVHWLLCQCLSLDVNLTWNLMKLKKLVCDAIAAGIFNDLGSGSNVELCIVTKEDILTGEEQQASLLYIPFAFCCDKGHQTNCSGHDRNYRRGHGDVIYQLLCLPSFKI
ncbi:uncharacterized protein LOC114975134 isoform X2 [Acropora millepora]|uniref:uncharacterized protein LOC114975134 isoform X2 n=1 Tax=Acropora millepora TaxID=45264 RepID=UPI001CF24658|nr:uncharacterized protein LOC114975134 isoform X2 [Acropora millepora]